MYSFKALVVVSIALSALASSHGIHDLGNHAAIAHRAAMPAAEAGPVVVPVKRARKRSGSSRCPATSASLTPSVEETTTKVEPTTTQPHTTTKTTAAPKPTKSTTSSSASDPLGILTGTHSGDGTFYPTGLGACGYTNSDTDYIAAVSHLLFDGYPGYNGANPNDNPLCGRKIKASYNGKIVEITAVDRCTKCAIWDLDFSPSAFSQLADQSVGRIHGMTWEWV